MVLLSIDSAFDAAVAQVEPQGPNLAPKPYGVDQRSHSVRTRSLPGTGSGGRKQMCYKTSTSTKYRS